VKNRIGSPDRARNEIGFEARIGLREGLEKLIAWRESHKAEVEERRRAVGLGTSPAGAAP
jgi:UDP-glucose 4-epimerase